MKHIRKGTGGFIGYIVMLSVLVGCVKKKEALVVKDASQIEKELILAKENTVFYIDPVNGKDSNIGIEKRSPWKSFKRINQLELTKGNRIEILSAGDFRESLLLKGKGTLEAPITIEFAQGTYNFYPEKSYKKKFHISNTNDAPDSLKAVAFYFSKAENVQIKGNGAEIIFRGKTMEMCIDNSKNISIEGLSFDYYRPTVSEFKVIQATNKFAEISIHSDSKYKIIDNKLIWLGEGWEHTTHSLWQMFDHKNQTVARKSMQVDKMNFSEIVKNKILVKFTENPGFMKGMVYQNRNTFRDYAAVFMNRSKNIIWKNVNIHFMHGMGVVSQFCENITFDAFSVKPKENSGRTCAAWADILHFSGCKGNILIKNSFLSAANDDAINVHGTHLRIVETLSEKTIKVRFMHPQTYGFKAFQKGDSIEFIRASSLLPFSKNKIVAAKLINEKEMELVLKETIPTNIRAKDVIENTTWTPDVTISNTKITHIPTRGVLLSTRGKVLVENNEFLKTRMSAVLISDDANGWFESGYVKDVTIRNNKFIDCGAPIINIHPENSETVDGKFVHKNIKILNNIFKIKQEKVVSAKSTSGISFLNNKIETIGEFKTKDLVSFKSCDNILIED